jgi:transcriptional regulator with XRE-family HTH domain
MDNHKNWYKACREVAGLTQEQAAELLPISTRQLSDYETGRTQVPLDMVERMADTYKAPLLAWAHIKYYTEVGKFFPDVQEPQTKGDMAFQAILAQDDLAPAVDEIKEIVSDGEIAEDEKERFASSIAKVKKATSKLFSVTAYADKLIKEAGNENQI